MALMLRSLLALALLLVHLILIALTLALFVLKTRLVLSVTYVPLSRLFHGSLPLILGLRRHWLTSLMYAWEIEGRLMRRWWRSSVVRRLSRLSRLC